MTHAINDVKFFELTRAQIQHEDSLINNRVTWLLTLQAFLFGAYGFSLGAESGITASGHLGEADFQSVKMTIDHARVGLALMSFFSSIVLLCGVAAAAGSMQALVKKWEARAVENRDDYPQIIGAAVPELGIYGGLLPTYSLPVASSLAWLWLEHNNWITWIGATMVVACAATGVVFIRIYLAGVKTGTARANRTSS